MKFIKSVGKNIKFRRGEVNITGMGKNITWKKGIWKKYSLPFSIKAVRKNIKLGRGIGNLWKKIKITQMRVGKNI